MSPACPGMTKKMEVTESKNDKKEIPMDQSVISHSQSPDFFIFPICPTWF